MIQHDYFWEINHCELGILIWNTCKLDYLLNYYVDLNYEESLCCKNENINLKQITEWSHIYYADYDDDVTVSPH